MAVILGTAPAFEQPIEYHIDRVNGNEYTRTWKGAKQTIDAIAAFESLLAESVHVTGEGGTYTLVARYATGLNVDLPVESQELEVQLMQQSILLNPTFTRLSAAAQALVRQQFDNRTTREGAITAFQSLNLLERPLAIKAYDLMVVGAESFENYAFVLLRTRTCSRRFSGKLDLTRINKIWSTEHLVAYTGNPILFDVPNLELTPEQIMNNLVAGWRQNVLRVIDVANGARHLVEQWVLAAWSRDLYPIYTPE
jgi:hypothetical protein